MLQAEAEGVLWGLDRVTFRNIILVSTMQKREHYEETLAGMSLLGDMTAEQRAVIADCLSAEVFQVRDALLSLPVVHLRQRMPAATESRLPHLAACNKLLSPDGDVSHAGWGDDPEAGRGAHKHIQVLSCGKRHCGMLEGFHSEHLAQPGRSQWGKQEPPAGAMHGLRTLLS